MKSRLLVALVILAGLTLAYSLMHKETLKPIGGERDEHGCLGPAGYTYDSEVGACLREFELTPDIKKAAKLAVDSVGQSYALTVVSFNSYEEPGSYDITLEQGLTRASTTVYIKNWRVVPKP